MRKLDDREPEAGRSGPAAKAVLTIAEAAGKTRGDIESTSGFLPLPPRRQTGGH